MEPTVHHFRGGWSVVGQGFATFAGTREEALHQYRQHILHSSLCSAPGCPKRPAHIVDGAPLCERHYTYVTSDSPAVSDDVLWETPQESDRDSS